MRILVIEPHADDAFLSVGYHLNRIEVWGKHPRAILTVFPETAKRVREAEAYANWIGAEHFHGGSNLATPTVKELATYFAAVIDGFDASLVVGPLGIQHEQHKLVATALGIARLMTSATCSWYLDVPYSGKMKNAAEINAALRGRNVVSYLAPPLSKFKAARFFKSQAKFFHFNTPESLARCPEVIVS